MKWVVDVASGQFLYGGCYDPPFNHAAQIVVSFADGDPQPDVVLERYDPTTGKRPATADELAAAAAASFERTANDDTTTVTIRTLRATTISLFMQLQGRPPTDDEIAAMTARAKAIYQSEA